MCKILDKYRRCSALKQSFHVTVSCHSSIEARARAVEKFNDYKRTVEILGCYQFKR